MNVGEKLKLKGETYTKSNKCCGANEFLLAFLCIIFSPLAVFLWSGADQNLLINIICFICGVIPGIIHGCNRDSHVDFYFTSFPPFSLQNITLYVILSARMLRRIGWSVLALFLPPLAIALKQGFHQTFLVNLLLTCLGFLPGVIHAWYIIWTYKTSRILGI